MYTYICVSACVSVCNVCMCVCVCVGVLYFIQKDLRAL